MKTVILVAFFANGYPIAAYGDARRRLREGSRSGPSGHGRKIDRPRQRQVAPDLPRDVR